MIDTHAHLNFTAFASDFEEVLARARNANIEAMVVVGSQLASSEQAMLLAEHHPQLFASVGIHPHHAESIPETWRLDLERLIKNNRVVALGEIGLDYHAYQNGGVADRSVQKRILREQLELAELHTLPAIIHCRDAWEELLPIVAQYKKVTGVFHCWSGTPAHAERVLAMGYCISFAGNLTYSTSLHIQEVAKTVPLDRMVLETDCPYLSPQKKRGLRNEPAFVTMTAAFLASLRGISFQGVDQATTHNARRIFRLTI